MKKIKDNKNKISEKKSCKELFTNHYSLFTPKSGFTLAEVLITLGVIGIVAAMTIPTLIANTQSQKFRSQFKKTLSTLNQAVKMSQAKYDMDFTNLEGFGSMTANPEEGTKTIVALFNGTLSNHNIFYNQEYEDQVTSITYLGRISEILYISLSDGSIIGFDGSMETCTKELKNYCIGWIDVNGTALPNKAVTCVNSADYQIGYNNNCVVDNKTMGDIFPIWFHDATVEPLTSAARYILNSTK